MAEQIVDRVTLAFTGQDLQMARELRKRAGKRGVNRLIKRVLAAWMASQFHENTP